MACFFRRVFYLEVFPPRPKINFEEKLRILRLLKESGSGTTFQ